MAKEKKEQMNLQDTLKDMEKTYGKGSVLHGRKVEKGLDVIDTGSIGLNHALGIGGVAKGKLYEIFGWESSGKSTLCQVIIGNFQKKKLKCVYVDAENSIERKYATKLGMDVDDLFIIQMDETAAEGAYDKVERLVKTGEIDIVILDSYNALQPKAVLVDGLVGDAAIGKHARMQGQAVQKANFLATQYGTTFIFIGQIREKIGVMFGSPNTTQGGNALKFYAHVRIEVVRSVAKDNVVKDGDTKIGNQVTFKVIKNKMGNPFTEAKLNMMYGEGFDIIGEIITLGCETGILKQRAKDKVNIITHEEIKYPEDQFRELLLTNEEFTTKLKESILEALNNDIHEEETIEQDNTEKEGIA